jgi:hypothetical protein
LFKSVGGEDCNFLSLKILICHCSLRYEFGLRVSTGRGEMDLF